MKSWIIEYTLADKIRTATERVEANDIDTALEVFRSFPEFEDQWIEAIVRA